MHLKKSHWVCFYLPLKLQFYLTTGTFLLVRNSRAISMSSNSTGQPQYSSHLKKNAIMFHSSTIIEK